MKVFCQVWRACADRHSTDSAFRLKVPVTGSPFPNVGAGAAPAWDLMLRVLGGAAVRHFFLRAKQARLAGGTTHAGVLSP